MSITYQRAFKLQEVSVHPRRRAGLASLFAHLCATGYAPNEQSTDRFSVKAAAFVGVLLPGAGLFALQHRVYVRMLSFQLPADKATFSGSFQPEPRPLSWRATYKLLGPTANSTSLRQFRRLHGVSAFSGLMSLSVCCLLGAHFQPVLESTIAPYVPQR